MTKGYNKNGKPFTTNKPKKSSMFRRFAFGKVMRETQPKGGWNVQTIKK